MSSLAMIRTFARLFCTFELYDLGYGDCVEGSGMTSAESVEDMTLSLAYVKGYADACRIACPYMTASWQIAQLIGIAAGTLRCLLEANDESDKIARVIDTYQREFGALAESLATERRVS